MVGTVHHIYVNYINSLMTHVCTKLQTWVFLYSFLNKKERKA